MKNLSQHTIYKTINLLKEYKLVNETIITPRGPKEKIYTLTKKGLEVLKRLKELNQLLIQ